MDSSSDTFTNIVPVVDDRDDEAGIGMHVHDPVWFLTRQWLLGEHQGEIASSPVMAKYSRALTIIKSSDAGYDPAIIPAEAIVESEIGDWWTLGRRIRAGQHVFNNIFNNISDEAKNKAKKDCLFDNLPPPYENFKGQLDGKLLWINRNDLGLKENDFGNFNPPNEGRSDWDEKNLVYQQGEDRAFKMDNFKLIVYEHTGGVLDWYSVDAVVASEAHVNPLIEEKEVIPSALQFPGAPASRIWEIEDVELDFGAYGPDSAHVPTAITIDLVSSLGNDWFMIPVPALAGHALQVTKLVVTDSFGRTYSSDSPNTLKPPKDWSLFKTTGLPDNVLLLWHIAELPLEGQVLERVQFAWDHQSNLLWAVERIIDGVTAENMRKMSAGSQPLNDGKPSGDLTKPRSYVYVPSEGVESFWHPYALTDKDRIFEQHGLVDLSWITPVPMPHPKAALLTADNADLHKINPGAVPASGIELERRWMLARDMGGNPVLWIQRQRLPLRTPPPHQLHFDVFEQFKNK